MASRNSSSEEGGPFTCVICGQQDHDEASMRHHLDVDHAAVCCPICSIVTLTVVEMERHVNDQHLASMSPTVRQKVTGGARKSQQSEPESPVGRPETSIDEVEVRMPKVAASDQVNQSSDVECPFCGLSGVDASEMESHVNTEHLDKLSPSTSGTFGHDCPLCGLSLETVSALELHTHTDHCDVRSPDSEKASSSRQWGRFRDLPISETEVCPSCGIGPFADRADFIKHFDQHHSLHSSKSLEDDLRRYGSDQRSLRLVRDRNDLDGGLSATPGIMPVLRAFSVATASGRRMWICDDCVHFASTPADRGWGCGYRNLQMLLSSMSVDPTLPSELFEIEKEALSFSSPSSSSAGSQVLVPSILRLQELIETAWENGFDETGACQLGRSLRGTRKWIGATEIVALLSFLGVSTLLVDFYRPTGPNDTHPRLLEWVKGYFEGAVRRHPLFLQHQGHSRTIVGLEEDGEGSHDLLIFDPSSGLAQIKLLQILDNLPQKLGMLRRTTSSLRFRQYQLVAVKGALTQEEREIAKDIRSVRIP